MGGVHADPGRGTLGGHVGRVHVPAETLQVLPSQVVVSVVPQRFTYGQVITAEHDEAATGSVAGQPGHGSELNRQYVKQSATVSPPHPFGYPQRTPSRGQGPYEGSVAGQLEPVSIGVSIGPVSIGPVSTAKPSVRTSGPSSKPTSSATPPSSTPVSSLPGHAASRRVSPTAIRANARAIEPRLADT